MAPAFSWSSSQSASREYSFDVSRLELSTSRDSLVNWSTDKPRVMTISWHTENLSYPVGGSSTDGDLYPQRLLIRWGVSNASQCQYVDIEHGSFVVYANQVDVEAVLDNQGVSADKDTLFAYNRAWRLDCGISPGNLSKSSARYTHYLALPDGVAGAEIGQWELGCVSPLRYRFLNFSEGPTAYRNPLLYQPTSYLRWARIKDKTGWVDSIERHVSDYYAMRWRSNEWCELSPGLRWWSLNPGGISTEDFNRFAIQFELQ